MNDGNPASAPKLYNELASWFPLLTPPEDYAEAAGIYRRIIERYSVRGRPRTLLELGCGGGHNALYLKERFRMTLTDISPAMLGLSRKLNPECEHLPGDMRTLRLKRQFDAVLIHDAICYMTTRADLAAALQTAFVHCAPGGVALFCPDFVKETFSPGAEHGGVGSDERAMRYLEWTWDADPGDDRYQVDFAYLLREGAEVRAEYDHHVLGLFSRGEWERLIREAGFDCFVEPYEHSQAPAGSCGIFIGRRI
jgi:SAM-dependent methyltransferase